MRLLFAPLVIVSLTACGTGLAAYNDTGAGEDTLDTTDTTDTHDTTDTTDTTDTNDCPDSDNDGVCNADDDCPYDRNDDSDNDGVCDSDDVCPGSPDNVDSDGDGLPNGCDACPNDRLNDADNDNICDGVDPCPGDRTNSCGSSVTLTITADNYPSEIDWELWLDADLYSYSYVPTDSGYFSTNGQTFTSSYEVPAGTGGCVDVYDSYGDGGSSGEVVDDRTGAVLISWVGVDYLSFYTDCFTVN